MEKLSDIKKELALLDKAQLMALCTRMAKLKKENKEFLSYLISDADDPQFYAEKLKAELDVVWKEPFYSVWALNKSLRKSLRLISKYRRFTSHLRGELELMLHFQQGFFDHWKHGFNNRRFESMSDQNLRKIHKLFGQIDEEFRADYQAQIDDLERTFSKRFV